MDRTIAIFDCDGTLIHGDSFFRFLAYLNGWPKALGALARAAIECLIQWPADKRSFLKQRLIDRLLAGHRTDTLGPALHKIRAWRRLKPVVIAKLEAHRAQGHHIVVATGALALYMPALLQGLPYDVVLATDVAVENGVFTNRMTAGNMVRQVKADRVWTYMEQTGPFADSYGYGNAPHDLPMLALVKHPCII